ncbi:DUF3572 family protein [Sphingorhabdus sp.]|jgi:hypothetical protein|uniref:DUF3572 family protein n=1 Tax=Sphingorhabdus sp. TaxID=1902408 RepID=UPI003BB016F2
MYDTNGKNSALDSTMAARLALDALAWILTDDIRAERFLALTGLTPDRLRTQVGDAGTQAAILGFLEAYQPDLTACAAALEVDPARLVAARMVLES